MAGFNCSQGNFDDIFITEAEFVDRYVGAKLYTFGHNEIGQLGNNSIVSVSTPVQTIAGGTNWKQLNCGLYFMSAIKTDGTLWSWGSNLFGQLGDNSVIHTSSPVQTIAGGTNWKQVSCGDYHTAAIKTDGTLWIWGNNEYGQLGTNEPINVFKSSPVQTIAGGTNWKQVACGQIHSAAIKTDGTLWVWGRNNYGQLGNNLTADTSTPVQTAVGGTDWKEVSCGYFHTAAIKTDGTLWLWGNNGYGQLGTNESSLINKSSPVQVLGGGINWKQVSCGDNHTIAIKTDGTLWLWGNNVYGQLGNSLTADISSPIQTSVGGTNWKNISGGGYHTVAIKTNGTLWSWGYNNQGQLGNNSTASVSTPVQDFVSTDWKTVACGNLFTAAIKFT